MDKLIITVAGDGTAVYSRNPYHVPCEDTKGVADEYIRAVDAGAAIAHIHGVYTHDPTVQPDGRRLSILVMEGCRDLDERIRAKCQPIMQFGMASVRQEQKLELWKTLRPEMSSINFNSHDEYFEPDPDSEPFGVYSVHPVSELREYCRLAKQHNIKLEIEAFNTGGYWAVEKIRSGRFWSDEDKKWQEDPGLLSDPLWISNYYGWTGQSWTPSTVAALKFMVENLSPHANWNLACQDVSSHWAMVAHAIGMGGHVRVGAEDCPFLEAGIYAKSNAELVEKTVCIARDLGRKIASPDEARRIIGLAS